MAASQSVSSLISLPSSVHLMGNYVIQPEPDLSDSEYDSDELYDGPDDFDEIYGDEDDSMDDEMDDPEG